MNAKPIRMTDALPETWRSLLHDADPHLVHLLSDRVEQAFGFRPHPDFVTDFLRRQMNEDPKPAVPVESPKVSARPSPITSTAAVAQKTVIKKRSSTGMTRRGKLGYSFQGTYHPCQFGSEVLVGVFETLARRDSNFLEQFSAQKERQRGSHGRIRRYLARTPEALYPENTQLAHHAKRLSVPGEWWIDTNQDVFRKIRLIMDACELAGLRYGEDLKVDLG